MSFPEIQFFYCLLSLVCYEHQGIFCNCFLKFPVSAVTLDDKALLLLLNKKNDEDFPLGWKGYGVELCAFFDAIRVIISPDIFLALIIPSTYDQFSFLKVEWHQAKFEVVHGCSEKQPSAILFCRIEYLYALVKCIKLPKK